jgi:hypothetical protein
MKNKMGKKKGSVRADALGAIRKCNERIRALEERVAALEGGYKYQPVLVTCPTCHQTAPEPFEHFCEGKYK